MNATKKNPVATLRTAAAKHEAATAAVQVAAGQVEATMPDIERRVEVAGGYIDSEDRYVYNQDGLSGLAPEEKGRIICGLITGRHAYRQLVEERKSDKWAAAYAAWDAAIAKLHMAHSAESDAFHATEAAVAAVIKDVDARRLARGISPEVGRMVDAAIAEQTRIKQAGRLEAAWLAQFHKAPTSADKAVAAA